MRKLPPEIRKAAILVASLSEPEAELLLRQMPGGYARRVRRAAARLGHVEPEEQRQVIAEFVSRGAPAAQLDKAQYDTAEHDGVEFDLSLVQQFAKPGEEPEAAASIHHDHNAAAKAPLPFGFLHDRRADELAALLRSEYPQVVSVVLSHLPAERAAEVLDRFDPDLQCEVLHRLAELEQADPEVVRELEQQIESLLNRATPPGHSATAGLQAVEAILNAAGAAQRDRVLSRLSQSNDALARRLSQSCGQRASPERSHATCTTSDAAESNLAETAPATHDEASGVAGPKLAPWTLSPQSNGRAAFVPASAEQRTPDPIETLVVPEPETRNGIAAAALDRRRIDFDDIAELTSSELATLLAAADPEVVILALAGASSRVIDAVTANLPARDVRQLTREMEGCGPLRLRDVDLAQERLAETLTQLIDQRVIRWEPVSLPRAA